MCTYYIQTLNVSLNNWGAGGITSRDPQFANIYEYRNATPYESKSALQYKNHRN